jgi:hypothetical protein
MVKIAMFPKILINGETYLKCWNIPQNLAFFGYVSIAIYGFNGETYLKKANWKIIILMVKHT